MGRGIVVSFDGEPSELEFARVERDELYARKVRLVVDEQGRRSCCIGRRAPRRGRCRPGEAPAHGVQEGGDRVRLERLGCFKEVTDR